MLYNGYKKQKDKHFILNDDTTIVNIQQREDILLKLSQPFISGFRGAGTSQAVSSLSHSVKLD